MSKIVSIVNQKGGVGKTTTAINLSYSLAKLGKRVLLVDLDPQSNASSGLGFVEGEDSGGTIYDVLASGSTAKSVLVSLTHGNHSVDLLPSNTNLSAAEVEIVAESDRSYRLKNALSCVEADYDIILIDCPPSLGLLTVNALTASHSVLIPLQCEYFALEGLGQLLRTVQYIRQELNSDLALEGILLTMYDKRNRICNEVKDQVIGHFGDDVFKTIIKRNVRLAEAPSHSVPIDIYDTGSHGASDYRSLADEFALRV